MLIEKFKDSVINNPSHICITDKRDYTYQEIYDLAICVREYIVKQKLMKNEGIGLIMPNSAFYVAAVLGCYMAGHPLILFDKSIKQYELNQFIEKLYISHLLVFEQIVPEFSFKSGRIENINQIEASFIETGQTHIDGVFLEGDFICQFTSGTNGLSKACIRTEKAVFNEIFETNKILKISEADHFLILPPIHHSYGLIAGVLLPLCYGCKIQFIEQFIPADVLKLLSDKQVNVVFAVPFMYKILIESLKQVITVKKSQYSFEHLKYCFSAGALLDPGLSSLFYSLFKQHICNDYGSTETGVICLNIDKNHMDYAGVPVDYKIDIVDESRNVLPTGQTGSILLSGKSLFRRYAIFNPAYDSDILNGTWLTGDIGYKNEEGYVYVKGRASHMINISGCKVDPVEVENVLLQYPGITQAVVVGVEKEYMDKYLKAFIVVDGIIKETEVYAFCKKLLTDYKVPRAIQIVDEIPKTQTGKVIRKNLLNMLR